MKKVLMANLAFAIACCLPAMELAGKPEGNPVMWGANVLAVGWSGIFAGVTGWYANPFWVLALVLGFMGKSKLAAAAGLVAIAIAYTTLSMFGRVLPADEGNVTHMTLVRLLPGFYVWAATLVTLPLCVFYPTKIEPAGATITRQQPAGRATSTAHSISTPATKKKEI